MKLLKYILLIVFLAQFKGTVFAQDCNYKSIAGDEFTFSEEAENLRHYGYQMWGKDSTIAPRGLKYDEYVGRKGKFLGSVTRMPQVPSATFLDAISENCEKLFYFSAGRTLDQLKKFPMLAGIRMSADDSVVSGLVGKTIWIDSHAEDKAVLRDEHENVIPIQYGEKCKVESVDNSQGASKLVVACGAKRGSLRYDPTYVLNKNPMSPTWGSKTIASIASGSVSLGMNADQVRAAWGKPKKVNKTISSSGSIEQWVYEENQYVYLKNGAVTSIQATETP